MKRQVLVVILIAVIGLISVSAFSQAKKAAQAKDPVCGMMVDKNPELSVAHRGETYYFCLKVDMEEFKANPDKYIKKR